MSGPHEQDTSRRDFFRTFGRETVRQAGAVAGAAAELRRSSLAAARVLFDPEAQAATDLDTDPIDASQPDATFRSAYRFTGTAMVALDARQLPGRVQTVTLAHPSEVAAAIRAGAINGGPVLAEVGAYGLAMAVRAASSRPAAGRDQQIRAAADTLRFAKPQIHMLTRAVDRMEALFTDLAGQATDPAEMADRVESEADSIASANAVVNAEIGRIGASAVLASTDGPLNLLIHGDMGPLTCGMVGMGTALIQAVRDRGRELHIWVTAGEPSGEGVRVAAFTLRQLDVPFTVIPDSAIAWLLHGRRIDSVVLRGDEVAQNGDCLVLVGGLSAAVVAKEANVPVHVLAPRAARAAAPTGLELHGDDSTRPVSDVVSSEYITRLVSEPSG